MPQRRYHVYWWTGSDLLCHTHRGGAFLSTPISDSAIISYQKTNLYLSDTTQNSRRDLSKGVRRSKKTSTTSWAD